MTDRLSQLATELSDLAEQDVTAHPDVLEHVHRALAGELDALGTAASS